MNYKIRPDRAEWYGSLTPEGSPAYLRIAAALRSAIEKGRFLPGDRLPSCRQLARDFGVHRHTAMASMNELRAQGWIESRERSRYVVSGDLPDKYLSSKQYGVAADSSPIRLPFAHPIAIDSAADQTVNYSVDLSTGRPDVRLFPLPEFRSCINDSLRSANVALMGYGDPRGTARLRQALSDHLRSVRGITGREIFVTNSAVEGIYLLAHLFLKRGDAAGIESIGFGPAVDAIRSTGADTVPIPVGPAGLDPDVLEKQLSRKTIRLLYLTPLHQYPTTVTLGIENRKRIYALARKHEFAIIEDDYDHAYHYASQPLEPMAAIDPNNLVMYVSSFSKTLFPSIRVGFMALPDYVSRALQKLRRSINRQSNAIIQEAVGRWMEEGGLQRHLRKTRRIYGRRRDVLCDALDELRAAGLNFEYSKPGGGMTVWVNTRSNAGSLMRAANSREVRLTPDAVSYCAPHLECSHVRLGFAARDEGELRAGAALFGDLVRSTGG